MAHHQIGDCLNKRWVVEDVRAGGMGIVYIVRDKAGGKRLAAKTFQDALFDRYPDVADRFIRETRAWIDLDMHPNVVRARFIDHILGKPYLFMDCLDGGDLKSWIESPQPHDSEELLRFAIQFCDGMTHALANGIRAHRDVKPANCLLTGWRSEGGVPRRHLKVTDFGASAFWFDRDIPESSSHVWRTPEYSAPELRANPESADHRADVYSFGMTLYEMVTGRGPFDDSPQPSHLAGVEFESIARLDAIIQRCLQQAPEDRFQSFEEVRTQLATVYTLMTGDGSPPDTVPGIPLTAAGWIYKVDTLIKLGRYAEALEACRRAIEIDPTLALAWSLQGIALCRARRFEEGLKSHQRAIELQPDDALIWNNAAGSLRQLGRTHEALHYYDRALALAESAIAPLFGKGQTLSDMGHFDEAIACFDAALARGSSPDTVPWFGDPSEEDILAAKARALSDHELDRIREAIACCDRALALDPEHPPALHAKAMALCVSEQFEEAIPYFDRALAHVPFIDTLFYKGRALYTLQRFDEAIDSFDRALEQEPLHADAWFERGLALQAVGQLREAMASFKRAQDLQPEYYGPRLQTLLAEGRIH